jgi:hypothetical protein
MSWPSGGAIHLEGIVVDSIDAFGAVLEACARRHPAQVNGIYILLSVTNSHQVFHLPSTCFPLFTQSPTS